MNELLTRIKAEEWHMELTYSPAREQAKVMPFSCRLMSGRRDVWHDDLTAELAIIGAIKKMGGSLNPIYSTKDFIQELTKYVFP